MRVGTDETAVNSLSGQVASKFNLDWRKIQQSYLFEIWLCIYSQIIELQYLILFIGLTTRVENDETSFNTLSGQVASKFILDWIDVNSTILLLIRNFIMQL